MELHLFKPGDRHFLVQVSLERRSNDGDMLVFTIAGNQRPIRVETLEKKNLFLQKDPLWVKVFADSEAPYTGWWRKMSDVVFDVVLVE